MPCTPDRCKAPPDRLSRLRHLTICPMTALSTWFTPAKSKITRFSFFWMWRSTSLSSRVQSSPMETRPAISSRTMPGLICRVDNFMGIGGCLLLLVGEITNHSQAAGQRFKNRVAPSEGKQCDGFLIHFLVCLGEEPGVLAGWWRDELLDGNPEFDLAAVFVFFRGVVRNLRELLGAIALRVLPVGHQ